MLTNIRGLVDRLDRRSVSGMMPLFEAVSNAIDAIGERGIGMSLGSIRIRLVQTQDLVQQAGDATLVVGGFDVSDNGIGFGDTQLAFFEEAYTLAKVEVGGKGIGRFTYLKVFSEVSVHSVFERNGNRYLRAFRFSIDREMEGADSVQADGRPRRYDCFLARNSG